MKVAFIVPTTVKNGLKNIYCCVCLPTSGNNLKLSYTAYILFKSRGSANTGYSKIPTKHETLLLLYFVQVKLHKMRFYNLIYESVERQCKDKETNIQNMVIWSKYSVCKLKRITHGVLKLSQWSTLAGGDVSTATARNV